MSTALETHGSNPLRYLLHEPISLCVKLAHFGLPGGRFGHPSCSRRESEVSLWLQHRPAAG